MLGRKRPWLGLLAGVAVAGCASASIESAQFGEGPAVETAIKRYYAGHASEQHGLCPRPYIDGITGVEIVEDSPERLVAEVRYFWRDRVRDPVGDDNEGSVPCTGFGKRTFTVTGSEDGPRVIEMSGPAGPPYARTLFEDLL